MKSYDWLKTDNDEFIDFVKEDAKLAEQFLFMIDDKYYLFVVDLEDLGAKIFDEEKNGYWVFPTEDVSVSNYLRNLKNEVSDIISDNNIEKNEQLFILIYSFLKFHVSKLEE